MQTLTFRRFVGLGAALLGILLLAAAPSAAADPASGRGVQRDAMTHEFETLLGRFPGTSSGTPSEGAVFTDLGGGFYTVFVPLSPALRARFLEAARESAPTDKAAQSLFVISVGQAPTVPTTPVAATHGALSDTTYPYTYWVITLNLGANTVTKTTSVKLTGPGLHFNRSANVVYGANGIWGVGYRPGSGVQVPGIYTLQGTVSGGGSITTKSFAVNP
jgi:hypothetical protein